MDGFDGFVYYAEDAEVAFSTDDPLVMEKELVHVGRFVKGKTEHEITEGDLDHWHRTHAAMVREGIEVPMPIEHTTNPEARRATLIETVRRPNAKGIPSLYGRVKFSSVKAKENLSKSGVSIFVPSKPAQSGTGKTFERAMTHVAFTDYPVIGGLEPFKPIVLSLIDSESSENEDVNLRELATLAGVDPALTDEQQIMMALSQVITKLKATPSPSLQPGAPQPQPGGPPARPVGPPPPQQRPMGMSMSEDVKPISGSLLSMARDNRIMKLDRLQSIGAILPPTRKRLEERFLKDETLAFSHEFDDGFDEIVKDYELNGRVLPAGKTGPQGVVALSKTDPEPINPLLADAEERAEAARRGRR